jgi:UDP-glucose 6-dehydrogenase
VVWGWKPSRRRRRRRACSPRRRRCELSAGLFARRGLRTVASDVDFYLVEQLRAGRIPVVEPGLDELVAAAGSAITYTADIQNAVDTDASIIIVSTPQRHLHGALSSSCIEQAYRDLGAVLRWRLHWRFHLVIISSTVMPGEMTGRIVPALEDCVERRAGISCEGCKLARSKLSSLVRWRRRVKRHT